MKIEQLISISLFTMATVFTIYVIMDRIGGRSPVKEHFENSKILDDETIAKLQKANEPVPTSEEAVAAHQTLLRYMKNDFKYGMLFAQDFGKRFFGDNLPFRNDFDPRKLMDNYRSPLQ
jgi:hypothetical protein